MAQRLAKGERDGQLHRHLDSWNDDSKGLPHNQAHSIDRTHIKSWTDEGRDAHLQHRRDRMAEKERSHEKAIQANFSSRCNRCNLTIVEGADIWWDKTTRKVRCRGTSCDTGPRSGDEPTPADKTPKPRTDGKATKSQIERFKEQVTKATDASLLAMSRAAEAEGRAAAAEMEVAEARKEIDKARRIEVVRTDPKTGTKRVRKLGPQHEQFPKLLRLLQAGVNVAMVGPAGTGKTRAPREAAKALRLKFYSTSLGPMTSKSDLLGFINGAGRYVTSMMREVYEKGGVMLLDEMDTANAAGLTVCNAMLDSIESGFADKMIERHPECHFVAAMNTFGRGADAQFVGRAQLDAATLNRWYYLAWNTDWDLTLALVKNKKVVARVQALAESAEKQRVRVQIGMRTAQFVQASLDGGDTMEEAEDGNVWTAMKPDDKQKVLAGLSSTAYTEEPPKWA